MKASNRRSLGRRMALVKAAAWGALGLSLAGTALPAWSGAAGAATSTAGQPCATPAPLTPAAAASTTGITSNTVTVGNVSILTGPVPGLFEGAPTGVKAYFAYVNSLGGIDGRKLVLDGYDDGFSGLANQEDTSTAVAKDFALVGSFSTFDGYGCKVLAENPAVPDVSVTLDPGTNALPNDFSAQPLAQGAATGPFMYIRQHYPKETKVGALVGDVDTTKDAWYGQQAALEHAGFTIAYVNYFSPLATDFTTQVIAMRSAGVNVLYLTDLDWQWGADIMLDMEQQGWRPTVVFSAGPLYADQFVSHAGGAANTNGILFGQGQALYLGQDAKSIPAVNEFNKWVKVVNPGWTPDLYTLYGWASAQLFAQALKAAGAHPTRGAVLKALQGTSAFSASGLLATANPAKKLPPNCYLMAQIKNGNYVRIPPTASGFACSGSVYWTVNNTALPAP
ncbi:MAG TPA: ABC transporter substrate-binding protein [Acidimicrobiales bacterium]|nr:ABC transporter substrate-binding protein [Acidimicrobiales bacterium]